MENLEQYNGKRIVLTHNTGDELVEVEGTVQSANEFGILIKPKGKTKFALIDAESIEEVRLAPDTGKSLTRKVLKVVRLGQARAHLLERHGYTLTQANALDEDQAFEIHEGIDHEQADLGHVHRDTSEEPAVVAAESDAA